MHDPGPQGEQELERLTAEQGNTNTSDHHIRNSSHHVESALTRTPSIKRGSSGFQGSRPGSGIDTTPTNRKRICYDLSTSGSTKPAGGRQIGSSLTPAQRLKNARANHALRSASGTGLQTNTPCSNSSAVRTLHGHKIKSLL